MILISPNQRTDLQRSPTRSASGVEGSVASERLSERLERRLHIANPYSRMEVRSLNRLTETVSCGSERSFGEIEEIQARWRRRSGAHRHQPLGRHIASKTSADH